LAVGVAVAVVGLVVLSAAATGGGSVVVLGTALTTEAATSIVGVGVALSAVSIINAKPSRRSDKERSTDKPSWVNQDMVDKSLSASQNASNMLNRKYGPGNWKKGPGHEFNKIVKWISRSFESFYIWWRIKKWKQSKSTNWKQ